MTTVNGWIGVDLDGTLAYYDGWRPDGSIGEPILPMVLRVKAWLREGIEVKIFTARVGPSNDRYKPESGELDNAAFVAAQRPMIEAWCLEHIGQVLDITATKDFAMLELWDDRCIQVIHNTGEILS